jgi:hypothetical protein
MLAIACGVRDREDLIGRYEADPGGRHEVWTLREDGTCSIVRQTPRGEAQTGCEWELGERGGRRVLVVTVAEPAGASRHRTTYVLTPSRFPGGVVSIPLGPGEGAVLRKID